MVCLQLWFSGVLWAVWVLLPLDIRSGIKIFEPF